MARIIDTADIGELRLTPNDSYWLYNGLDTAVTYEVYREIRPQLDNVTTATYEFSKSLQAPVLEMALRGLLVNQNRRGRVLADFATKITRLEAQLDQLVTAIAGQPINWRSPVQLNNFLYDVMNLPEQKKRNTKGVWARSSDREALEKLQAYTIAMPIIAHLLLLRDIGKAKGFLETGIDPDGRMRTSINIAGTNTGRFSSSESDYGTGTNLQNVARDLRSVFVADPGHIFINLDLEQADSRNLGALMWDAFLHEYGESFAGKYLTDCESGDLHTRVCKMCNPLLGWGREGWTDRQIADQIFYRDKTYRDGAKVLGHGSNFYGKPPTMAKHTHFPLSNVKDFQRNYFEAYPSIPQYHKYVSSELKSHSSLTTLFGRRRFFFGRPDDDATLRAAIAYSPQSMTGDEINTGILRVWRAGRVHLLIQVHDSILLQCREEEVDEVVPWALETLKAPLVLRGGRDFCVPTEAKVGWNWGDYNDDPKRGELNLDGLKKWKGSESRKRLETETELSVWRR